MLSTVVGRHHHHHWYSGLTFMFALTAHRLCQRERERERKREERERTKEARGERQKRALLSLVCNCFALCAPSFYAYTDIFITRFNESRWAMTMTSRQLS